MEGYYTVRDLELITGFDEEEILIIIKKLNEEILKKYSKKALKPLLFDRMIEKKYFLKGFNKLINGF